MEWQIVQTQIRLLLFRSSLIWVAFLAVNFEKLHFLTQDSNYRKTPKFSDARKLCCNLPKIQTKRPNLRVFRQNDANGIANSEDPDPTAQEGSSLIWVCTVCPDLSVRKLRVIMVVGVFHS